MYSIRLVYIDDGFFMGLLADFFVGSEVQAHLYFDDVSARKELLALLPSAEYKALTGLELGILWPLLADEEWDLHKHQLTALRIEDQGEALLYVFPRALTELLAGCTDDRAKEIARKWAATEELRDFWTFDSVYSLLANLRRLAIATVERGDDSLYLSVSL